MKSRLMLAGFVMLYVPYVAPYILLSVINPAGNPAGDSYVGQPGSSYDAKANPPSTNGEVTYTPPAVQSQSQSMGGPMTVPGSPSPSP